MRSVRFPLYVLIVLSFFTAFLLDIYPLPFDLRLYRPQFVVLIAIYWIYVLPQSTSMVALFLLGVFQDLLEGAPIGQHPLSLLIVSYICLRSYRRVRHLTRWQESMFIGVLVSVAQLINYWMQSFAGREVSGLGFLIPGVTSALIWPILTWILDGLLRQQRISRES